MFKRFFVFALVLFLLIGALPLALSQSECQASESSYARAVQLHDMGDYDEALRYYECARQEDPDNTIIPLLIENVYEDIANASTAWSSAAAAAPEPTCSPYVNHGWRGETAFARGDVDHALIHLQCVLLRDPADIAALSRLGGDFHQPRRYPYRTALFRSGGGGARIGVRHRDSCCRYAADTINRIPDARLADVLRDCAKHAGARECR